MKSLDQHIAGAVNKELTRTPDNPDSKMVFKCETKNLCGIVPNSLIISIKIGVGKSGGI